MHKIHRWHHIQFSTTRWHCCLASIAFQNQDVKYILCTKYGNCNIIIICMLEKFLENKYECLAWFQYYLGYVYTKLHRWRHLQFSATRWHFWLASIAFQNQDVLYILHTKYCKCFQFVTNIDQIYWTKRFLPRTTVLCL